jgi:hypothetical protein
MLYIISFMTPLCWDSKNVLMIFAVHIGHVKPVRVIFDAN